MLRYLCEALFETNQFGNFSPLEIDAINENEMDTKFPSNIDLNAINCTDWILCYISNNRNS